MTGNQQTVLIVDDSAEDRAVYRRYLLQDATYTYQIFESESGEEALQLCQQIKLDVILLDFLLPDMDGLEFLNELKTQRSSPSPPIVMLTGQGNEAIAVQVMQNGVQNYLVKGQLTPETLHLAIHNVIDLSKQTTPVEQQTRTILIVDNCAKDRATYRSFLLQDSTYNYQIFESESGEEALQSYLWLKPDAILLEFKLPGIDGLEFLNQLKTHLPRTQLPVIMITGQGDEAIAVQAIKNGAQDYLVKSNLTPPILCRATKTIVQQTHLQGLLEQSQERQRLISAIALRIRQSLNLNEILNTTVNEVRQFLTCDRVVVYQFAPDMSGDIVAESVVSGWTPALGTTITELDLLEELGVQIAVAIQQALLFEQVQRENFERKQAQAQLQQQIQRRLLLEQITNEIRQRFNTSDIFQTTATLLGRAFLANRCVIHTYVTTPTPKVPFVAEYLEPGYESILDLEVAIAGNPHMETLLAQDQSIASPNVYTDPLLQATEPICRQIGLKSILAIRTSYQGVPNGIIGLHQCSHFRTWNADDIGSPILVGITQAYNLAASKFSASIFSEFCIKNYILSQVSGRA